MKHTRRFSLAFPLVLALRGFGSIEAQTPPLVEPRRLLREPVRLPAHFPVSPKQYDAVLAEQNVMITMRDGTRLATDIWRPAQNGVALNEKFPVLLLRTPYDTHARAPLDPYFA